MQEPTAKMQTKFSLDPISFINPGVGLIGNVLNFISGLITNKQNKEINEKNLDYNAAITHEQWARDDSMHQREVADLEAAGLSPLANTAGASNGAPVAAPSPLAMQAPQFDVNSLINSVLQQQQLNENKRHNLVEEGHKDTDLILQAETIKNKSRELDIENKKVEAQIKYQADLIENENKQIEEVERHNKSEESLKKLSYESEMYFEEIKQQVPGNYSYQDIYDYDIYKARIKLWNVQFEHFMESLGATQKAHGESISKSKSGSGNIGLNAGAPNVSAGVTAGASGAISNSESQYDMENLSEYQKQQLIHFYSEHPKPVFHLWRPK